MGTRLPTILGKAIDDVVRTLNDEYDEAKIVDLTECIARMEDLMDDLQSNSKLRQIVDDGEGALPLFGLGGCEGADGVWVCSRRSALEQGDREVSWAGFGRGRGGRVGS